MAKSDCGKQPMSFPETERAQKEMERIFPQSKRIACSHCGVRLPKHVTWCDDCSVETLA